MTQPPINNPTPLETVTGNLAVGMGVTLISALSGTPIAALLPVLTSALASGRHRLRVEEAVQRLNDDLVLVKGKIRDLTDAQYKFVNELVLTVLQTTEEEKLRYLRRAVISSIDAHDISHTTAAQAARAIRDMTAGELDFILRYANSVIMIGPVESNMNDGVRIIDRNSCDLTFLSGLLGLGVLIPAGSTIDDGGRYVFAPVCATLVRLIDEA